MTIDPLADRVLIKRVEAEAVSKGGILIPDTGREKPLQGIVIAVGEGRLTDDRRLVPLRVKRGDRVLFGKYAGTDIKLDDVEHVVVREDEILGIVR